MNILCLYLLFLARSAYAIPLATLLGNGDPAYYQLILPRFLHWYEARNGEIQKKLSPVESAYIEYCFSNIQDWNDVGDTHRLWNHFRVAAHLDSGKLYTKKISIGPSVWTEEGFALVRKILAVHQVNPTKDLKNLYWLEWDLDDNVFSLYFKETNFRSEYESQALLQFSYNRSGKLLSDPTWYLTRKKITPGGKQIFYPIVTDEVELFRDDRSIATIYETSAFDGRFVADPLRTLARDIFTEFRFMSDSFQFKNEHEVEVYYP